jgi:hypothetical protein
MKIINPKLKPNEHVVKVGNAKLIINDEKISAKIIFTNQDRLYIYYNEDIIELDKNNVIDILYFDRFLILHDRLDIITKYQNFKLILKKRNTWEILLGKLY